MEITNNEDDRTATIITNMAIPDNADGYFLLNIDVFDGLWHDTTTVKIYVINENHRVEFVFQNDYNTIFEAQERISIVLQNIFAYTCVVEAVVQNTDDNGNILENETVIRVHFIDSIENLAVDKSEIENLANDITLLNRLQNEFDVYSIVLLRFLNTSSTTTNVEAILKAWLIAVCVVLGVLLLVLIILFILKTRSLSQRLNKLSVIRYASQESGLNRKVAPTTNKHTIEGSNPAYTEEKVNKIKDFDDTASIDSGDSDLVGIENNPEFEPKVKGF